MIKTNDKPLPRTTQAETDALIGVIYDVWNAIAPDCGTVRSNSYAIELCIDADRLTTFCGDAEEGKLAQQAWNKYAHDPKVSYATALRTLARKVSLV